VRDRVKRLNLAALSVTLLVSLVACGDDRPCLRGHEETILVPVFTGKTTILIPEQHFVCDVYGPRRADE
jgi:hypothetical protein